MSTGLMRAECRKFVPNIFNKAKCSNCFRQKEEHSAEALECNRAARKISKCGYLFVAPGWDFSNPLNRTKRWQRRWFVLYDDGELSYSLDEHPETVPQASIDMNKVLEVTDAEEITGNSFSLAITAPETVHFVKGTCREEAKWWRDVLNVFPRSKGRHKRNATFPGSQTSAILQQSSLGCRAPSETRPRFNSCHTDSSVLIRSPSSSPQWLHVEEEIYPTRDIKVPSDVLNESSSKSMDSLPNFSSDIAKVDIKKMYRDHQPISSTSPPTRDKIHSEEKTRTRRALNREKRGLKTGRSYTEELTIDGKSEESFADDITAIKNSRNLSDGLSNILRDNKTDTSEVATRILLESEKSKRKEKLKDIADSLTRPRARSQLITSSERRSSSLVKPTRDGEYSEEEKTGYAIPSPVAREEDVDGAVEKPIRGDPDGCGLDLTSQRYSPSSELRVDLPAEDLLNIKKGWLMKQGTGQEWTKHWFVLRGTALMYYRDPTAEDKGIFDGVLDLSSVNNVTELQVQRNYGFQTITWDDRRYVLSAVTAGIRSNWMAAIRRAAGIPEPMDMPLSLGEKLERDLDRSNSESSSSQYFEAKHSSSHNYLDSCMKRSPGSQYLGAIRTPGAQFDKSSRSSSNPTSLPITSGSQYVENLLQKSSPTGQFPEGGGVKRSSSAQSVIGERHYQFTDEDFRSTSEVRAKEKAGDWSETPAPLPPSPPLNRTPISRVKERAKTQTSRSRVYNKRSKSSPPMLRKNNFESVCSDDVLCSEKREESVKRPVILDVDRHLKEIEELKSQLNFAISERSNAEKELLRLRQRKSETNFQVEELLRTLKLTEDELKLKTQELEDFDNLKQRYSKLAKEHEIVLTSWRENSVSGDWRDMYHKLKKEYGEDKESWESKFEDVNSMLRAATERCEMLTRELAQSEETVEALKQEVTNLSERLMRDIEENEGLYSRMRELEGRCLSSSRGRGRSVDSLSDLTNIDLDVDLAAMDKERVIEEYEELKCRFEKAIQEIRAMKRELRESHACYDDLELTVINLRQDSKRREEQDKAQSALMASRIEDLTLKLSASEKQSRMLKQKISRSESREKRRSLSLKGESFQIGREMEEKLAEMEAKINALEMGKPAASVVINPAPTEKTGKKEALKTARLRRKSLDSATSSEPMKLLIRLSSLENKIAKADERMRKREGGAGGGGGGKKEQPELKVDHEEGSETFSKALDKIQECRSLLVSMKSGKRPPSPLHAKTFMSIENKLLEIENILSGYEELTVQGEAVKIKKSVECMVSKLELLLKSKLTELLKRRNQLREAGQLDEDAKLKLLAEKLAYESILIKKIIEAVETFSADNNHCKHIVMNNEIQETNRLINVVKDKIEGRESDLHSNSLDYLTKVLTEALVAEGEFVADGKKMKGLLTDASEPEISFDKLLENQSALTQMVAPYKSEKLKEIADMLAMETLCLTAEYEEGRMNDSEDRRIREAWALAQEALNKELVQAEISHVTMRCASMYESGASRDLEENLTLIAEEYKRHEEHVEQMNECLRCIMDITIEELTNEYEKSLSEMREEKVGKRSSAQLEQNSKECRRMMEDFVKVVAQKALIDERIRLLAKTTRCERSAADTRPVVRGVCLKSDQSEPSIEARFIYLYQKFSLECMQSVEQIVSSRQDLSEIVCGLNRCAIMIRRLKKSLGMEEAKEKVEAEMNLSSVRDACSSLSEELEDVVKCLQGDRPCTKCDVLEESLHKLESQYDDEIKMLRHCHEKQMKDLRGELESQRDSLVCQHEQEQAELMERARKLERRLGTLDAEYSQQMDNLRSAYHRTLSAELDKDESMEDSIRHRYQAEIEQLRALCEKGLVAVDNSHRRIIAELEEKHRQELAAAAAEKEQALAEETQATLAALDAMRKAHETEVQKEINKFKAEFLKKMQSNHDISALHKEHKAEMDEIKKEILSLSEKYSVKCVESASLEEQLNLVNKQLSQAQQHIMQLDARNKQLRAHLVSEAKSDFDEFGSLQCQKSVKLEEEDRYHGSSRQAHSLDEYSRPKSIDSDQPTREPLSLDRYLKKHNWKIISGTKVARNPEKESSSIKERVNRWQEPTNLIRAELLRSPKCSLFTTSNFNSPSLNQLSGMVAERKKLFEH